MEYKVKPQNKYKSGIACAVANCGASKRSHPDRKLYNFPKASDTNLFANWIQICDVPESRLSKTLKICEVHFRSEFKGRGRLRKNSIPELNLPSTSAGHAIESLISNDSDNAVLNSQILANREVDKPYVMENLEKVNSTTTQRYHNIKTYSYNNTSPSRDLTIFDFETIKTPTTKRRASKLCDIEVSGSYCLKHIKQSEYYRKQCNLLKRQNALPRLKYQKLIALFHTII